MRLESYDKRRWSLTYHQGLRWDKNLSRLQEGHEPYETIPIDKKSGGAGFVVQLWSSCCHLADKMFKENSSGSLSIKGL